MNLDLENGGEMLLLQKLKYLILTKTSLINGQISNDETQTEHGTQTNEDYNKKSIILTSLSQKYFKNSALYGLLNEFLVSNVTVNKSEEPRFRQYQKMVLNQLEQLRATTDDIKKLNTKRQLLNTRIMDVNDERLRLETENKILMDNDKKFVGETKEEIMKEFGEDHYNATLLTVEKINTMRSVLNGLLFVKELNWEENPMLLEILKNIRFEYKLE